MQENMGLKRMQGINLLGFLPFSLSSAEAFKGLI
jgi:hypothetical protein